MSYRISKAAEAFKPRVGPAFEPGDEEYERSVATSNLLFRFSRPDLVLQPQTPEHVQAIVFEAKAKGIHLVVKCGGHSFAGYSTAFKTKQFPNVVSVDLRQMIKAKLYPPENPTTVTFSAGCQLGHLYRLLVDRGYDGKMVNGGRCPFVGTSGFLLGGGLGLFGRSFGMACDALKEVKIVTADGALVTVGRNSDPNSKEGRLFWALCGAGAASFGIVVEMTLDMQTLESDEVVSGQYQWCKGTGQDDLFGQDVGGEPDAAGRKFLDTMAHFYTGGWPNEITIDSLWQCDLRLNSGNAVRFISSCNCDKPTFDTNINSYIRPYDERLAEEIKKRSLPESSTQFLHESLVFLWSEDTERSLPTNNTFIFYSSFSFDNQEATIRRVTEKLRIWMLNFRKTYNGERVAFSAYFIHSGGSMQKPNAKSAYYWRDAVYNVHLIIEWQDKWLTDAMRDFMKAVSSDLRPFTLQGKAAYVNFADAFLDDYEAAYFGENKEKLRAVKSEWDPDNFFQGPQSIHPSGPEPSQQLANDIHRADSLHWKQYQPKKITGHLEKLADLGL